MTSMDHVSSCIGGSSSSSSDDLVIWPPRSLVNYVFTRQQKQKNLNEINDVHVETLIDDCETIEINNWTTHRPYSTFVHLAALLYTGNEIDIGHLVRRTIGLSLANSSSYGTTQGEGGGTTTTTTVNDDDGVIGNNNNDDDDDDDDSNEIKLLQQWMEFVVIPMIVQHDDNRTIEGLRLLATTSSSSSQDEPTATDSTTSTPTLPRALFHRTYAQEIVTAYVQRRSRDNKKDSSTDVNININANNATSTTTTNNNNNNSIHMNVVAFLERK